MPVFAEVRRVGHLLAVTAALFLAVCMSASAQSTGLLEAQSAVELQLAALTGQSTTMSEATSSQLASAGNAAIEAACPGGANCQEALDILTVIMAVDPELVDELLPTVLANNGDASAVAETVLAADSGDATVLALAEALEAAGYTDVEAIIVAAAQEVGTAINTAAIPSGSSQQPDNNQFSSSDPPTPSGS